MSTSMFKIILISAVSFALGGAGRVNGSEILVDLGRERLALENELETKAEKHLSKVFALKDVAVQIQAVPFVSLDEIEQEEAERFALPGVPMAEDVMTSREAPAMRYFLNRIRANVYIPEDFPDEEVSQIRTYLTNLLNLDFDRGDRLDIERTLKPYSPWDFTEIINSPHLYQIPILLFAFIFLMGPVGKYLKQARRKMEVVSVRERGEMGAGMAGFSQESTAEREAEEERKYFTFINREIFSRLLYVIEDETVEATAVLCEYLPAELSARLLSNLPPGKKTETIKFMSRVNYLSGNKIKEIEGRIKEKVESMVGGNESLFKLFKELDIDEQRKLVEATSEVNRELAEELNKNIIDFEDFLEFDASTLISIIRRVGPAVLARALQELDKEAVENFKEKLPTGITRMLEEELKFMPELNESQISEVRKNILKSSYEVLENLKE